MRRNQQASGPKAMPLERAAARPIRERRMACSLVETGLAWKRSIALHSKFHLRVQSDASGTQTTIVLAVPVVITMSHVYGRMSIVLSTVERRSSELRCAEGVEEVQCPKPTIGLLLLLLAIPPPAQASFHAEPAPKRYWGDMAEGTEAKRKRAM